MYRSLNWNPKESIGNLLEPNLSDSGTWDSLGLELNHWHFRRAELRRKTQPNLRCRLGPGRNKKKTEAAGFAGARGAGPGASVGSSLGSRSSSSENFGCDFGSWVDS